MVFGRKAKLINRDGLLQMHEVSFSADAETLRKVADFLNEQAAEIELRGNELSRQWHSPSSFRGHGDIAM